MLTYAFAGLEAGITGVLWMFGCFFVAAYWNSSGLWSVPNLFATVFYGDYAYEGDFRRSTWAGIALIVVIYGLLGLLWGCFWKENRKPMLSFYGAMAGLVGYYVFFSLIWTHLNPLIPLFTLQCVNWRSLIFCGVWLWPGLRRMRDELQLPRSRRPRLVLPSIQRPL